MIKAFWIVNDSKRFFICDFRDWWLVTGGWWLGNSRLSHRHFERMREIFVIRSQEFSLSPHVPRTSLHASSVVHTASALSAPTGHLPLEGKAKAVRCFAPSIKYWQSRHHKFESRDVWLGIRSLK